ncbi:MAG: hypothetical protein ABI874_09700 [Chloroflexota bacterium]
MLRDQTFQHLAQLAAREIGRVEGAEEDVEFAQRGFQQSRHAAKRGIDRGLRIGVVRQLRTDGNHLARRGEDVLHQAVMDVQHDALQFFLSDWEDAPRREMLVNG